MDFILQGNKSSLLGPRKSNSSDLPALEKNNSEPVSFVPLTVFFIFKQKKFFLRKKKWILSKKETKVACYHLFIEIQIFKYF